RPSSDFEAGLLFQRHSLAPASQLTAVDAKDFRQMWKEIANMSQGQVQAQSTGTTTPAPAGSQGKATLEMSPQLTFEVGKLFEKYSGGGGSLSYVDFEKMIRSEYSQHSGGENGQAGSGEEAGAVNMLQSGVPLSRSPAQRPSRLGLGPRLTHYNETTGVPLPTEAVASQSTLGHTCVPLHEAYNRRLARLQSLVSTRLMPAREQLLQLRRRLHAAAEEV
ncbi:unnamed protein product, partial [Chrysoparadoxa australica]